MSGADGRVVPAERYPRIVKPCNPVDVPANLADHETACRSFTWDVARALLDGLPGGRGLNIAHEAVDRHVPGPRADRDAIRWIGQSGDRQTFTYRALKDETNRFANALTGLGLQAGDSVFVLCGRIPELHIAVLGTLKARCVVSPLFPAFGPEPLATRLTLGEGRVLVTTTGLYRKVAALRAGLPKLEHVIVVPEDAEAQADGTLDWRRLLDRQTPDFTIPPTLPDDPALLHFTSGTTGRPKWAIHAHEAVVMHHITGRYALDLHDSDIFWCTADPGRVTGTSYGIIAPLTNGVISVVAEAEPDARTWYSILQRERVSVWCTEPTAMRMMMKLGTEAVRGYDLSALRFLASAEEPLNPEAVIWSQQAFGRPFHDNWSQAETSGIMIANYASMDVKPGSMGKPLPGIKAAIVQRDPSGSFMIVQEPMVEGELALRAGWPSMMRSDLHGEERYRTCFAGPWYLTGDRAMRDADGYYWMCQRQHEASVPVDLRVPMRVTASIRPGT
ncbi:MAG: AMP-binding protein [Rhodopila sp.]